MASHVRLVAGALPTWPFPAPFPPPLPPWTPPAPLLRDHKPPLPCACRQGRYERRRPRGRLVVLPRCGGGRARALLVLCNGRVNGGRRGRRGRFEILVASLLVSADMRPAPSSIGVAPSLAISWSRSVADAAGIYEGEPGSVSSSAWRRRRPPFWGAGCWFKPRRASQKTRVGTSVGCRSDSWHACPDNVIIFSITTEKTNHKSSSPTKLRSGLINV